MSEQIKQELIEDYKSGSSVVFLATYYSLPEREVLEIISEHDALNATREPVGADDAIDRAKMRADLAVRLEVIKEIWGDETEPQIVGHKDGQVEVLERILSDIDFGLWQATRHAADRQQVSFATGKTLGFGDADDLQGVASTVGLALGLWNLESELHQCYKSGNAIEIKSSPDGWVVSINELKVLFDAGDFDSIVRHFHKINTPIAADALAADNKLEGV